MIEIRIGAVEENCTHVERAGSLFDIECDVDIWIGDEEDLSKATPDISVFTFIFQFFPALLDGLSDLEEGRDVCFRMEGRTLMVEPSDGLVQLGIDRNKPTQGSDQFGPRFEVELEAFAAEVIDTADEFVSKLTEHRPGFTESKYFPDIVSDIEQARDWYQQKYGSVPDSE